MEFGWRPGIGDPTLVGWLTVLLYFVTAFRCYSLSTLYRRRGIQDGEGAGFWAGLAFVLAVLGLNKQLDLQSALTDLGRLVFHALGWYDHRAGIQVAFILLVAIVAVIALIVLVVQLKQISPSSTLTIAGACLLLAYILIRASSFHNMDQFIGERVLGLKWNWVIETGGILLVLGGCVCRQAGIKRSTTVRYSQRGRSRRENPFSHRKKNY